MPAVYLDRRGVPVRRRAASPRRRARPPADPVAGRRRAGPRPRRRPRGAARRPGRRPAGAAGQPGCRRRRTGGRSRCPRWRGRRPRACCVTCSATRATPTPCSRGWRGCRSLRSAAGRRAAPRPGPRPARRGPAVARPGRLPRRCSGRSGPRRCTGAAQRGSPAAARDRRPEVPVPQPAQRPVAGRVGAPGAITTRTGPSPRTVTPSSSWSGPRRALAPRRWRATGSTGSRRGSHVIRGPGGPVRGVVGLLDLTAASAEDRAADPGTAAAWATSRRTAPARAGEVVTQCRFIVDAEAYQGPSPTLNAVPILTMQRELTTPHLAWDFVTLAEPDRWNDYFAAADLPRAVGADFVVGGRRYGLFAHDFRRVPVEVDDGAVDRTGARRRRLLLPAAVAEPELLVLSHTDFDAAVRQAVRDLHRPDLLALQPAAAHPTGRDPRGREPAPRGWRSWSAPRRHPSPPTRATTSSSAPWTGPTCGPPAPRRPPPRPSACRSAPTAVTSARGWIGSSPRLWSGSWAPGEQKWTVPDLVSDRAPAAASHPATREPRRLP